MKGICSDCQCRGACEEDHPPKGRMRVINPGGAVEWCSVFVEADYESDDDMLRAEIAAEDEVEQARADVLWKESAR